MKYKEHKNCRVCGSSNLTPYLDLGMMPLSNNLLDSPTHEAERFPLKVLLCEDCGLSQLSIVIDPKILFGHYVYRSSIAAGYIDHCRKWAEKMQLSPDDLHIDIAGNDGALLRTFKSIHNHKTLSVDPAENLARICEAQGIRAYSAFWGTNAAQHLINTEWPKAKLITATNVLAHCDDVRDFMQGIKMMLANDGLAQIEFPYLIDFIEKVEFDTVYFEHLSYFSIGPLLRLCHQVGLTITDVEKVNIHGGSVRASIKHEGAPSSVTVGEMIRDEVMHGYTHIDKYKSWESEVNTIISRFRHGILLLRREGLKVAGFAASAKGNTLLNCAGICWPDLMFIIDETPEKIGKVSPGTHLPIWNMREGIQWQPDYLVILSWNFKDEIISKCRESGYTGKFILPLTFEILD